MPILIKTSSVPEVDLLTVTENAFGNPHLSPGTLAYVWISETAGGGGLSYRGIVEAVSTADGGKLSLEVRLAGPQPQRPLTTEVLAPYRDDDSDEPRASLSRKLYRHAHNKIVDLSPNEAAFTDSFFEAERA